MRLYNIYVYMEKDGFINLRCDNFFFDEENNWQASIRFLQDDSALWAKKFKTLHELEDKKIRDYYADLENIIPTAIDPMFEKAGWIDEIPEIPEVTEKLPSMIDRITINGNLSRWEEFEVNLNGKNTKVNFNSDTYSLPKCNLQMALSFLSSLNRFIQSKRYDNIQFNDVVISSDPECGSSQLSSPLEVYLKQPSYNNHHYLDKLMEDIFVLVKNTHHYLPLQRWFDKILQSRSVVNAALFSENLEIKNRFKQFTENKAILENDDIYLSKEIKFFNHFSSLITARDLFKKCIGKIDKYGKAYSWKHTEWDFLSNTQLDSTTDGKMMFSNLHNRNYAYYYARFRPLYKNFEQEMRHLAEVLEIKFEEHNFHEKLILAYESGVKLQSLGFHCKPSSHEELIVILSKQFENDKQAETNVPLTSPNRLNFFSPLSSPLPLALTSTSLENENRSLRGEF